MNLAASGDLAITSPHLTSIPQDLGGVPFPQYSASFLADRLPLMVTYRQVMTGIAGGMAAGTIRANPTAGLVSVPYKTREPGIC